MKHFVILLGILVIGYALRQLMRGLPGPKQVPPMRYHATRLGLAILVLMGLLALAYHLPAIQLL